MSDLAARSERVDHAIQELARAIVKHPIAAQAAYQALVREGRAFAATDEGRRIRNQLAQSELVARLRTAWELVTFGMLRDDAPPGAIPSVLVEALVQAVLRDRFEARLHDAMLRRATEVSTEASIEASTEASKGASTEASTDASMEDR